MLAARVEPKNGSKENKKIGNFKPLVLSEFQAAVDTREGELVSGRHRTGLGPSETEIGKAPAETRRRKGAGYAGTQPVFPARDGVEIA